MKVFTDGSVKTFLHMHGTSIGVSHKIACLIYVAVMCLLLSFID